MVAEVARADEPGNVADARVLIDACHDFQFLQVVIRDARATVDVVSFEFYLVIRLDMLLRIVPQSSGTNTEHLGAASRLGFGALRGRREVLAIIISEPIFFFLINLILSLPS